MSVFKLNTNKLLVVNGSARLRVDAGSSPTTSILVNATDSNFNGNYCLTNQTNEEKPVYRVTGQEKYIYYATMFGFGNWYIGNTVGQTMMTGFNGYQIPSEDETPPVSTGGDGNPGTGAGEWGGYGPEGNAYVTASTC